MTAPESPPEGRPFCYRCHKAQAVCICGSITPLRNRTHVHVIQHPRERHKAIGTVRLVRLGLARCSVEVNWPRSGQPSRLAAAPPPGAAVLYPSAGARPVEELPASERPSTLIVLDGTWHQAKTLHRNNPWLDALPHLVLANPEPSRYRIRAEPARHYLSTVEAIVTTLGWLEPDLEGRDALLAAFDHMIDAHVDLAQVRQVRERRGTTRAPGAPLRGDVILHAETVGPSDARRIVHLCAVRLATGERFEGIAAPGPGARAVKLEKMGLGPADLAGAPPEAEILERWGAFVRPGEVLCAWSPRILDVVRAPEDAVLLKAEYCNATRGAAGDLRDVVERNALPCPPPLFRGRAGVCLAQALAVHAALARTSRELAGETVERSAVSGRAVD